MSSNLEPKIHVACLAAYNNGYLHGAWIDAAQDIEGIYRELQAMLASSPIPNAEEWTIHDYKEFSDIQINEYDSIETVKALADFVSEHGELGAAVYNHYGNMEDAIKALEEDYSGVYDSEKDFAEEFLMKFTRSLTTSTSILTMKNLLETYLLMISFR
jgi:antirestriction protein